MHEIDVAANKNVSVWNLDGTALLAALLPIVFLRVDAMLPDPKFTSQVSYFSKLLGYLAYFI